MKKLVDLIESIRGFDLVLFCIFLIGFDFLYVKIAAQPHTSVQLYLASWAMSVLTSLLAMKIVRYARERLHGSA